MEFTGERMVPEDSAPLNFWEHVYRYRFACRFVRGRQVVDVACGEGYGSAALLRAGAAHVIGIDISEEACAHARAKYSIDARCASAESLPLEAQSIDTVVSFETIEHLDDPESFAAECARVLRRGGTAVISTPNRAVYSEHGQHNEFHRCEMDRDEFERLLRRFFRSVRILGQSFRRIPYWHVTSLGIQDSPWIHVKGVSRFRRAFLPRWMRDADPVPQWMREDAAGAILQADGPITRLINPMEVRRCSRATSRHARYVVAVCRRPIAP